MTAVMALALEGCAVVKLSPREAIDFAKLRRPGLTKVGEPAPDVMLTALDGTTQVRLGERFGGRPLVLIFGSYT